MSTDTDHPRRRPYLSNRAREFLSDLEQLCEKHGIQIAVTDYDGVDLWDREPGDSAIHADGVFDRLR